EELLWRMHLIHVLPAAARVRLQKRRKSNIDKYLFPIQRIDQIPHGFFGRIRRMLVMRQDHRRRNRHAHLIRQRIVKKLVVRRPPERIVDHRRPLQHRVLQICPVERNVLRNAVNDHVVLLRLIHPDATNLHKLGGNTRSLHRVDLLDQSRRKGIFHTKKKSDFLVRHNQCPQSRSTRNTFPPSAATAANHVCCCPRRYPANAEFPCHAELPPSSRSRPGTYPSPTIPAQTSSAGTGSGTTHRSCSVSSPADY